MTDRLSAILRVLCAYLDIIPTSCRLYSLDFGQVLDGVQRAETEAELAVISPDDGSSSTSLSKLQLYALRLIASSDVRLVDLIKEVCHPMILFNASYDRHIVVYDFLSL